MAAPAQTSVATTEAAQISEWWGVFNDPKLTQLVTDALKANLDLRTAVAALRQARATRNVTASAFWPNVNATGSYTRSATGTTLAAPARRRDLFQAGLDATWELDFFGGVRRGIESADAERWRRHLERARRADHRGRGGGDRLRDPARLPASASRSPSDNLKAQQQTAELTRQKFMKGLGNELDVANADALVATTEATIPPLETSARQTIYALSVLLARPPAALKEELAAAGPIPQAPARVPVGLPSALLQRRPDIRQSEALVHAATAQIGVARPSGSRSSR